METNNQPPLVSVIVTTYKHEQFLEECLSSITSQDVDFAYEIIVANDCSPDATANILERHTSLHPDIIHAYNHPANLGMHENLFFCFSKARGKYIAICEGDDYWNDQVKLAKQVAILKDDDAVGMVCSNYRRFHQTEGRLTEKADPIDNDLNFEAMALPRLLLLKKFSITTPTIIFRRDILEKAIVDNPDFFSKEWPVLDFQIFMELAISGTVVYLHEPLATYRVLPVSASRREKLEDSFRDHLQVTRIYLAYAERLILPADDIRAIKAIQFQGAVNGALTLDASGARSMLDRYLEHFPFQIQMRGHRWIYHFSGHPLTWKATKSWMHMLHHLRLAKRCLTKVIVRS